MLITKDVIAMLLATFMIPAMFKELGTGSGLSSSATDAMLSSTRCSLKFEDLNNKPAFELDQQLQSCHNQAS
eukprot:5140784-Amphidinium_carterae.2